jgi:hypothetical protein
MSMNDTSTITLPGIIFLCVSASLILLLDKKYIIISLLLASLYMTYGQGIVVGGLHFFLFRLLILVCWVRMFFRGEIHLVKLNPIDKIILIWAFSSVILNTINWRTYEAFQEKIGFLYDALGLYGIFRLTIFEYDDIRVILKFLSIIIIPVAILMAYESRTGINLYSYLGGVPERSAIRNGLVRCQGPFRHPILAGTFGATSIPLFIALYASQKENIKMVFLGIVSSLLIILASASSGPLLAFIFIIIAFMCWGLRDRMRLVRWGVLLSIITLHVFMKAPVWYLIAKVSDIFGGGGWHRAYLINQAIEYIGEWWLVGAKNTGHWMPYALAINPDASDITNTYIGNGTDGGLITMFLFIYIIVKCFSCLGKAQHIEVSHPLGKRFCVWAIGVALFSHVVTFFSISYFDQSIVFWYMLLAIISSMADLHSVYAPKLIGERDAVY